MKRSACPASKRGGRKWRSVSALLAQRPPPRSSSGPSGLYTPASVSSRENVKWSAIHTRVWLRCTGFSHPYKEAKMPSRVLVFDLGSIWNSLPVLTASSGLLCPAIMSATLNERVSISLPLVSPYLFISQHYNKINSAITYSYAIPIIEICTVI